MLQALFECDLTSHSPVVALHERLLAAPLPSTGEAFSRRLLEQIGLHQVTLDAIIQHIAPEWPIEQIAPVDRNILRLAACEILYDLSTPPRVAINEAVELAKMFGSDSSSRFVNGVLGTLLRDGPSLRARFEVQEGAGTGGGSGESVPEDKAAQVRRSA